MCGEVQHIISALYVFFIVINIMITTNDCFSTQRRLYVRTASGIQHMEVCKHQTSPRPRFLMEIWISKPRLAEGNSLEANSLTEGYHLWPSRKKWGPIFPWIRWVSRLTAQKPHVLRCWQVPRPHSEKFWFCRLSGFGAWEWPFYICGMYRHTQNTHTMMLRQKVLWLTFSEFSSTLSDTHPVL